MVWPTRVRHRERKHAFEEALDEARLTSDDELQDLVDGEMSNPMQQPGVSSFGDITVASGYVAPSSLARVYGDSEDAQEPEEMPAPAERPSEAADKLKAALNSRLHTTVELARLRRHFAAANHPDKVVADLREEAVAAMAEVNAVIDRALKRAKAI